MVLAKRLLHRVHDTVFGQSFDRANDTAVGLHRKNRARLDRFTVEVDRACAARRRVTADIGAGESTVLPDVVDEQRPRLDVVALQLTVDGDGNVHVGTPGAR